MHPTWCAPPAPHETLRSPGMRTEPGERPERHLAWPPNQRILFSKGPSTTHTVPARLGRGRGSAGRGHRLVHPTGGRVHGVGAGVLVKWGLFMETFPNSEAETHSQDSRRHAANQGLGSSMDSPDSGRPRTKAQRSLEHDQDWPSPVHAPLTTQEGAASSEQPPIITQPGPRIFGGGGSSVPAPRLD